VHDFHPPIGRSGLYWVVDVPRSDLTVAPDGRSATLRLSNVEVIDQPRWPKPDACPCERAARRTLRWTATDEPVEIDDPAKQFRFRGWKAKSALEARLDVPSIGFTELGSDRDVSRELRHHRGRGEREILLTVIAGPGRLEDRRAARSGIPESTTRNSNRAWQIGIHLGLHTFP
jgi:hypothetical protein